MIPKSILLREFFSEEVEVREEPDPEDHRLSNPRMIIVHTNPEVWDRVLSLMSSEDYIDAPDTWWDALEKREEQEREEFPSTIPLPPIRHPCECEKCHCKDAISCYELNRDCDQPYYHPGTKEINPEISPYYHKCCISELGVHASPRYEKGSVSGLFHAD